MLKIKDWNYQGYGTNGTLMHYWWECKMLQPLWKTTWWFLVKLNIRPPYDSAIPLPDIYPREMTMFTKKLVPKVQGSFINNSQKLEITQCPNMENNKVLVHTTTWMNLKNIMLSKRTGANESILNMCLYEVQEQVHITSGDRIQKSGGASAID